jgi:N-acylglucosamine 2-epimerase (GlcNAc 2-epimerase)
MKLGIVLVMSFALLSSCLPAASTPAEGGAFCSGLVQAVGPKLRNADAVFIRSYEPGADEASLPAGLATTAFVYDNALAAIALVACGHMPEARSIGNALARAAVNDRSFADGRVRNAYRAGPVGEGAALLPGWWDDQAKLWAEDAAQDGTSTGNVAWAALALLTLHQATGDPQYLSAAKRLIDWIIANTACEADGFCGGFHGYDPHQVKLTWMSTEHNVDVAAAADWLARVTGEQKYDEAAKRAHRLLDQTFRTDHFLLGTKPDGSLADEGLLALDVQLWPWMAVPDAPAAWRKALGFAESHLAVDGGFDFNGDRDGVWVEGTAQAAMAYRIVGDHAAADRLLSGLAADRTSSGLLNATRGARLTTGLSIDPTGSAGVADFFYYKRPHLGATAWAALAETGWNPFTGAKVP